jgi:hypothetical protein
MSSADYVIIALFFIVLFSGGTIFFSHNKSVSASATVKF